MPVVLVELLGDRNGDESPRAPRAWPWHGGSVTGSSQDGGEFRLGKTLRRDIRRVLGEAWRRGIPRAVARTFEDLERFYLSEERQKRLTGMGRARRWLHLGAWLLKSLFQNLSPARSRDRR